MFQLYRWSGLSYGFPTPRLIRYFQAWFIPAHINVTLILHGWRPAYIAASRYPR